VLDLAVRGKLVEQDIADEPATELLQIIAIERETRIANGDMRRGKPLDEVDVDPHSAFRRPQTTLGAENS